MKLRRHIGWHCFFIILLLIYISFVAIKVFAFGIIVRSIYEYTVISIISLMDDKISENIQKIISKMLRIQKALAIKCLFGE